MASQTICKCVWLGWSVPLADQALRLALDDFPGQIRLHIDEEKRFSFVTFDSFEHAAALLEHDSLAAAGITVKVRPAKPKVCLYLMNLPFKATPQQVFDFCSQYGPLNYVYVANGSDGRPAGYAFVSYNPEAMDAACTGLNGAEFEGRPLSAQVADHWYTKKLGAPDQYKPGAASNDAHRRASIPAPAPGLDRILYTSETPAEVDSPAEVRPTCPLRYRPAPDPVFTRRKGSRRRRARG